MKRFLFLAILLISAGVSLADSPSSPQNDNRRTFEKMKHQQLVDKHMELRQRHHDDFTNLTAKIKVLNKRNDDLNKQIDDLNKHISELQKKNQSLNANLGNTKDTNDKLHGELQRKTLWLWLGGASVVIVLCGLGWVLLRPTSKATPSPVDNADFRCPRCGHHCSPSDKVCGECGCRF